jgi:hypothetical protein
MDKSKGLNCSAETPKVNTLTTHGLEHGAEGFESSTQIPLAELKLTVLEMIRT